MKRREFIGLLGGATTWPLAARAQQPTRMRRIGVLLPSLEGDAEWQARAAAFVQALQNLGWTSGVNLQIDYRWPGADPERVRVEAADLVSRNPDVILASTVLTAVPLVQATRTIPIVFSQIYDPVSIGLVASLARPEGNITGFTLGEFSLGGKMLEVLKEVAPRVSRVAVILNPDQAPHVEMWRAIDAVSSSLGVRATASNVSDARAIVQEIEKFAPGPDSGLVVLPAPVTVVNREQIIALAARYRFPAVYGFRFFVAEGGLVSYGIDPADHFRRAASSVDRILRGAKPSDLPVQQPTQFELAVNLRTAKELGLSIPESFLLRADEVIE
jgi:putative ABC transport system substrate-binding protein